LIDFPGLGAVGFVCSGGRLCLDVAFTSGGGECLHTTTTLTQAPVSLIYTYKTLHMIQEC
jgi:hypothetical protein